MSRGFSMTGKAAEMIDQMLPKGEEFDRELGGVGLHREMKYASTVSNSPIVCETRYIRPHRAVDVTSYGDTSPQEIVTSPGLDVTVTGTKRDGEIIGVFLLAQGRAMQIEGLERSLFSARHEHETEYKRAERDEEMLLAIWDEMGKKRRISFTKKHPKTAKLMEELAEKRDKDAYYDAMDNDW